MMLLDVSVLSKQNIKMEECVLKMQYFCFKFSLFHHISVSLSLIRQVAWLLGKLMVDNIIYQIKRYLCITNKRERELWYSTRLPTIFQLYRGGQFHMWRKPVYPEVTAKLNHIMLYLVHVSMSGIQTPNFSGDRH